MLDTHPYRVDMIKYASLHGLAYEKGFDPSLHGALGVPGREFLLRIQKHMKATKRAKFKHVRLSGVLDKPTRDAFDAMYPQRPTFVEAFQAIALHDDQDDKAEYYTQGPLRWQGVRAVYGKVTKQRIPTLRGGDCSAGYTRWVLWGLQQALGRVPHDVVNGSRWQGGYTGTIAVTCRRVMTPQVGDAILYGRGDYSHVTGVYDVAQRTCISHGRARAEIYGWDQHPNRAGFWRPQFDNA